MSKLNPLELIFLLITGIGGLVISCPLAFHLHLWASREINPPSEQVQRMQLQNQVARLEMWRSMYATVETTVPALSAIVAGGLLCYVLIWIWRKLTAPNVVRAQNGLYPVLERDTTSAWARLTGGQREYVIWNPNTLAAPGARLRANGDFGMEVDLGGLTTEQVLAHAQGVQAIQMAAARTSQGKSLTATDYKAAKGWYDKPSKTDSAQLTQRPDPPAQEIAPQEQVYQAQPTRLALGQAVGSGALVHWDLELFPFARIHGATQGGKTSLARFLVTQAIRHGFEVVVYDRRRGKDWGVFDGHAQIEDVRDVERLALALAEEVQRYGDRDEVLGEHGAPNLSALAEKTGRAYRRRLVVIEELGTQHMNAKAAGQRVYGDFISALRKLTSEAGATGIHGLYIDQIPDAWDQAVRYNAGGSIVFHLPDHGGQVAGYQRAHELGTYQCHFDGRIVRAGFLTETQIRQSLAQPRSDVQPLTDDSSVSSVVRTHTPPPRGRGTEPNHRNEPDRTRSD